VTDVYFRKPKSARADLRNEAWWYANQSGIEVHVQMPNGQQAVVFIPRRQLVHYIRRTEKA
jgi:hypothetical protein